MPTVGRAVGKSAHVRALACAILYSMCSAPSLSCRSHLYYKTRQYDAATLALIRATPRVVEIEYRTSAGRQVSFYVAPEREPTQPPEQLWLLFGGIDTLAFGWHQWMKDLPNKNCGLLLIEYPGYGLCEGLPRAKTILESSRAAWAALARHLDSPPQRLERNLGLLGHSLGSLTMLQFAPHVAAQRLVLISPMTSLAEQTKQMYGPFVGVPLSLINPDRYDNRARLRELVRRPNPPRITIIHGGADAVVPVAMGRELAALAPSLTTYYEIPGAGHPGLIAAQLDLLFQVMGGE